MRLNVIAAIFSDDSGALVVEYGILVCFVSTATMLCLTPLGEAMISVAERVTDSLSMVAR